MSARETVDIGKDPSGRTIRLTRRMLAAYERTAQECGFAPTILQGAFMRDLGGGAKASAGYHDRAGCIDTSTRELGDEQQDKLIRCARTLGWAVWRRDESHGGMTPHMHWVLLDEPDMADGARRQQDDYLAGLDGLASRGPDYHWRPPRIRPFDYDKHLEESMPNMNELKEELVPVIVNQLMKRNLNAKGLTVADALRQASTADDVRRLLRGLPKEVAAAVDAALPEGQETLTRAEVKAAAQSGAATAVSKLLATGTITA